MSATNLDDQPATESLHQKMDGEIAKLIAETAKIIAETSRINREASTYPWLPILTAALGSTGIIGAIVAIVIGFHK
jgi:hypothetical protein